MCVRVCRVCASVCHTYTLTLYIYRSVNFCSLCTRVFDRNDKNSMKFDDFIQCCVMIKGLTESFQRLDVQRSGVVNINYETVRNLQVVVCIHYGNLFI